MLADMLIFLPGFTLLQAHLDNNHWYASLASTRASSPCPMCGTQSSNIHSHYVRTVTDLPVSGKSVSLELHVRRFRCRDPGCSRRVFCERFDDPKRYAHRTERQRATLSDLGIELGGRAGARTAQKLGLTAGRSSVLLAIRSVPLLEPASLQIIGVDDFAFKRGHTYGTVIVNLETHRAIDLLPDRKSSTLEAWLKTHPSVRIVTRDRSKEYAQGITQGAPRARQVVDRWHLLKNLRETLQRVVDAHQKIVTPIIQGVRNAVKLPRFGKESDLRDAARERQRARHERVRTAFAEIGTISGTAKKLKVSRWLVRESLKLGDPAQREANKRIPSQLDAFESHLFKRWTQGCQTTTELWREIQSLGFQGSRRMVRRWMLRQRLATNISPSGHRGSNGTETRVLHSPR
ncbi:MAG: ISL3 family transposase [Pleurocapsa sp. SU_196_0]|nr:ISL3 family transposase [Pleurocapsa sp. SU_196_0]